MAKLTRDEMEAVIARGGSVMYRGRIIRTVKDLPSRAELAVGDPVAEAKTRDDLDAQIAELERQKAKLTGEVQTLTATGGPVGGTAVIGGTGAEDVILAGNVDQVRAYVQTVTDAEELVRLHAAESDREVARKGVLAAIEARAAELEG